VADVARAGAYELERRKFATMPERVGELAAWLREQEVEEAVMESTAQYWKPVWETLERHWQPTRRQRESAGAMAGKLHLARAKAHTLLLSCVTGPRGYPAML
jgi:hypothetical protein